MESFKEIPTTQSFLIIIEAAVVYDYGRANFPIYETFQ
jgi:hypothetical protein